MNLNALAHRIRSAREKRRLKQSDIAHALQISAQAVSKWERGENAPDIAALLDLCLGPGRQKRTGSWDAPLETRDRLLMRAAPMPRCSAPV